jgi:hypothetical protein
MKHFGGLDVSLKEPPNSDPLAERGVHVNHAGFAVSGLSRWLHLELKARAGRPTAPQRCQRRGWRRRSGYRSGSSIPWLCVSATGHGRRKPFVRLPNRLDGTSRRAGGLPLLDLLHAALAGVFVRAKPKQACAMPETAPRDVIE